MRFGIAARWVFLLFVVIVVVVPSGARAAVSRKGLYTQSSENTEYFEAVVEYERAIGVFAEGAGGWKRAEQLAIDSIRRLERAGTTAMLRSGDLGFPVGRLRLKEMCLGYWESSITAGYRPKIVKYLSGRPRCVEYDPEDLLRKIRSAHPPVFSFEVHLREQGGLATGTGGGSLAEFVVGNTGETSMHALHIETGTSTRAVKFDADEIAPGQSRQFVPRQSVPLAPGDELTVLARWQYGFVSGPVRIVVRP